MLEALGSGTFNQEPSHRPTDRADLRRASRALHSASVGGRTSSPMDLRSRAYHDRVDKRYRWALAVIGAVAIAAIIMMMNRGGDDIQVQTAEVTSGLIARRVLVTGTLEPARMVEVGSRVSGTVTSAVDFNSRVKAGQVLARLDPTTFHTRLAEAEAGVLKAQAERASRQAALDDARRKFENVQALAGDEQLARAELDLARKTMLQAAAEVRGADADIAAARAAVTQARVSLDHTIIRSPIDGVVIGRHVDVGQTVVASVNAPILFTLGDLRRMRLLAEVPEGEVGGVQPGSQVRFEIESIGGRAFTGTVAQVRLAPQVVLSTATNAGTGATTAATGATTATAGTSGSSPGGTSATTQPAGSSTRNSAPAQASGSSTSPSPAAPPTAPSSAAATTSTQQKAPTIGVVSYIAVIEVDAANQDIPPGGTALVILAGSERAQAVRVPNNALTFAPSAEALAAVNQEPPALSRTDVGSPKQTRTRHGYVWKFQNSRFVPVAVETGIADESWTELVAGGVRPGDRVVTAALPLRR
jgi:HlyD family secretion protein